MELNRLLRVVRDRWIIIVGLALLGFIAGWYFTYLMNQNRVPEWRATIPIRFDPQEGQTLDALGAEAEAASDIARQAAAELLTKNPTWSVDVDEVGRLIFVAQGASRAEATANAQTLLDAYYMVDPRAGVGIEDRLAQIREQTSEIEADIAALQPPLTEEEQAIVDQYSDIDQELEALRARRLELLVEETTASSEEKPSVTAQRERVEDRIDELSSRRAALPPPPATTLDPINQMELDALTTGKASLATEYERLILRSRRIIETVSQDPVQALNLSGSPTSPWINGLIGMVGGLLLAVFGLMFVTRATKPIWLPEDLEIPFLGDIPARRVGAAAGEAWYDSTESGPRKPAIQALRSVVEAQIPSTGATLAITGHHVPPQGVQALTTDLAVSMASAGSNVLLVDADFDSDSALGEYRVGGPSLANVLALNAESLGFDASVKGTVSNAMFVRPGLAVIPSGPPPPSPGDALAGREFRAFVDEATKHFDVVMVSVGDISAPAAQIAMQRLRRSILILTPGRSTVPQIDNLLFDVVQRQVTLLGAVFLQKSEHGSWSLGSGASERTGAQATHSSHVESRPAAPSPISRLSQYPMPGEKGSALKPQDSLKTLTDRVGVLQEAAETNSFGQDLLAALDGADPEVAYEAVGDYLVSRVEDLMTAGYGQGNFSDAAIDEVVLSGFVPFRSLSQHPSVGRWLTEELTGEVSPNTAEAITLEMERILASGKGGSPTTVDEWLLEEFFARHLARTSGQPSIWHLTSEEGAVQVLVPARRFDKQKIENLMTQVTSSVIDELERTLKVAHAKGDDEHAAITEARIREVRRMDTSLGLLLGITVDETSKVSRKSPGGANWEWDPDWSMGYRPNLAPLQRLGLLPFPVLDDDEMNNLLAAG